VALSKKEWLKSMTQLKTPYPIPTLGYPNFTDRIKGIAQEINLLRVIAESIRKGTAGDKSIVEDDYYRAGVSFGLTPEQWIVGRKLPQIYESFFGSPPQINRSRDGEPPYGKGLDFLMWCLDGIGIALTKETVCTYYYDHRIGIEA
jgi:hypothetical protein